MSNADPISKFQQPTCTALLSRRLTRRISQIYDDALAPHGLTIGQFGILAKLEQAEPIAVGALAERLSADASTLSRLLKPLHSDGLISLGRDAADARAKEVRLTEAGRNRAVAARGAWETAQKQIADRLGADRLAALRFLLNDAYSLL